MTIGKNTINGKKLLTFVERIEAVNEEIQGRKDDVKEIYEQAKAAGFKAKPMRQVVAARALDEAKFREAEELRDLYFHAVGLTDLPLFEKTDKSAKKPRAAGNGKPVGVAAAP